MASGNESEPKKSTVDRSPLWWERVQEEQRPILGMPVRNPDGTYSMPSEPPEFPTDGKGAFVFHGFAKTGLPRITFETEDPYKNSDGTRSVRERNIAMGIPLPDDAPASAILRRIELVDWILGMPDSDGKGPRTTEEETLAAAIREDLDGLKGRLEAIRQQQSPQAPNQP